MDADNETLYLCFYWGVYFFGHLPNSHPLACSSHPTSTRYEGLKYASSETHKATQAGITRLEESAIYSLPHTWAHWRLLLARVAVIGRREIVTPSRPARETMGNFVLLDSWSWKASASSGFDLGISWRNGERSRVSVLLATWGHINVNTGVFNLSCSDKMMKQMIIRRFFERYFWKIMTCPLLEPVPYFIRVLKACFPVQYGLC